MCLMGLGWGEAVPVDTHVWQIAQRDYRFGKGKAGKTATLSKALYDAVGDHFRSLWGEYAGWAHSVLFTADLKAFAEKGGKGVAVVKIEAGEEADNVVANKGELAKAPAKRGTKRKENDVKVEEVKMELSPKRRRTRSQARLEV